MEKQEQELLQEEFIQMVLDTNQKLVAVLGQNPVRGGRLGNTRLKIRGK